MIRFRPFPKALEGKLIVSCQAPPGSPLHHPETLQRIAASALQGGAGGLRANGAECIRRFCTEASLPIIGIEKHYFSDRVDITPDFDSAREISEAGANVIALDCSSYRSREAAPWPELVARIHEELHRPVLADIASLEDAIAAAERGADAVATTLYGYTPETQGQRTVNWTLVEQLVDTMAIPVIVEGHLRRPDEVRRAFDAGAYAVVIGAAITSPQSLTAAFVQATRPCN